MSSGFYLVNSECGAHLAVDQSLIYGSHPKMFLLFNIEANSSFKTIFLDSYLGIVFVLFFCSWIYWNPVINFPKLVNLVYPFLIHSEMNATQMKPKGHK